MPSQGDNRHIKQVKIDQSAIGVSELVADAAVGAEQIAYLVLLSFSLAAAGTLTVEDTDGTDLTGQMNYAANDGQVSIGDGYHAILEGAPGKGLQINTTGAGALAEGWARYFIGEKQI